MDIEHDPTPAEPEVYLPLVPDDESSSLPCPECGKTPVRLQEYMYVMSFVFFTRHARYESVVCRECATRRGFRELTKSALLGWWGIPWGLLTFQALWIDLRSLMRWSTIPSVAVPLLFVAAVGVPVFVGYKVFQGSEETEASKATGDYVSNEAAAFVQIGHDRSAEGNYEEALEYYQRAYGEAPNSSVINDILAHAHLNLGDTSRALEFADRAMELNPANAGATALSGVLYSGRGDLDMARARAQTLRSVTPQGEVDVSWTAELFYQLEDWPEVLRVATPGAESFPHEPRLRFVQLSALLALDRLDDYSASYDLLPEDLRGEPSIALTRQIFDLRTGPPERLEALTQGWLEGAYGPIEMRNAALAAERSGQLPAVRAAVRDWLRDVETPGDVWWLAEPWFGPEEWGRELDDYLEERPEIGPGMLRLQGLDPVLERQRIVSLMDRLRRQDDPRAFLFEVGYFNHRLLDRPRAERSVDLARHAGQEPEHLHCRLLLANYLVEDDPASARAVVDALLYTYPEDEALSAAIRLVDAGLLVVENRLEEARERVDGIPAATDFLPYASAENVDLNAAEIALHSRDPAVLGRRLERVLASEDPASVAAGLILHWSGQVLAGQAISYRSDVDRLLERPQDELDRQSSSSLQSLLVAEGRTDRAWFDRATGDHYPETFRLVAAFKKLSETGDLDRRELAAIAGSERAHDFAPRIARTLLQHTAG